MRPSQQRKSATDVQLSRCEDFGSGSSREAAVWALQGYGFRAVIAPRFGDIFRGNALQRGLLAVVLPMESVEALWDLVERAPGIVSSTIR
ncbi:hypothetical protein [Saccharopolyspora sp. NPDC049357]|uniref:hypothetical protein n=1 Tax=Saccharopolyspora sp. NPDC049357 TaxID=3154507 RepID=UPI00342890FE